MNSFLSKSKNRFLLSVLSGCLMFLSFPYTGSLTLLVFISFVPLLLLEEYIANNSKGKNIFIHSYLTFLVYNLGSTWWIWNASEGGMLFAVFLNSLLMSLFFQFFHVLKKVVSRKHGIFFLFITWISIEYFHYSWELSWPWLNLGNVFSITPKIVQWYEYTGVLGGSLWILIVNYCFYNLIISYKNNKQISKVSLYILSITLIVPIIISLVIYSTYNEKEDPIEVVCLQPNIDPYNEKFNTSLSEQVDKLLKIAQKNITENTTILIAPETAISASVWENNFTETSICSVFQDFSIKNNVPILTGASTLKYFKTKQSNVARELSDNQGYYESYNTSILFDNNKIPQYMHKSKLVLGVEKIPFNTFFPWLEEVAIDLDGASGSLGVEQTPKSFQMNNLNFTSTVCYESVYGGFVTQQVKNGAGFIFIITNDGWWGDTPGYKQHVSFASLRAIENRRSIARSANTGISCFINQKGDIFSKTKWWVEGALKESINKNNKVTFYTKYGDLLGEISKILFYFSLVILLYMSLKKAIKK